MAKYVPDIKTDRWVIVSSGRAHRPDETHEQKTTTCPFCEGNESLTPPEVYRVGLGAKNEPGWNVRVVPNKYPITDIHEVIIHSPSDTQDIEELPLSQVINILTTYRDRFRAHQQNGHVIIFCNHGAAAGASLKHPHSQLVVVPKQINLDALSLEPITNVIETNTSFTSYCPDFSQWPFEVWIAPKAQTTIYSDITESEIIQLANILQHTLKRLVAIYQMPKYAHTNVTNAFVYNYYIYHGENWFLRIIPRFIYRAGFELGTGLLVNVVDPTEAAAELGKIMIGSEFTVDG